MTTQEAAAWDGDPRSWRRRLMIWLGHYSFEGLAAGMAALVLMSAGEVFGPQPGPVAAAVTVLSVAIPIFMCGMLYCRLIVHDAELCPLDFDDARAALLDPEGEIARHRRTLVAAHSWTAMVVPLVWALLVNEAIDLVYVHRRPWWTLPVLAALLATYGYVMWVQRVHRRLQDFCPYCHRRRGGGHSDPEPDPDPAGNLTAV